MHKKLFIPGPVEVHEDVLRAMSTPMVAHRGKDYEELHKGVKGKLQKLLYTNGNVFLITSSATGAMEGSIRNLSEKRILSTTCGAFSERWYQICIENGKESDQLAVEWGNAVKPEMIESHLATGKYDALTLVHSETSTGVLNPLEDIAKVVRKFPDVMFIVDAVSSMVTVKIEPERLGIDLLLAGVQKGFGLPPGFTVVYVSERAMKRAENVKNRGSYFNLTELKKFDEKNQTPNTPSISHIYALDLQLNKFLAGGLDNRFARTLEMAKYTRSWAENRFKLFPEKGYETVGLTAILNDKGINVKKMNDELIRQHSCVISDGYGKIKEKTFRIAHMADITMEEIKSLLRWIDEIVDKKLC